jgi:hypothetical protein
MDRSASTVRGSMTARASYSDFPAEWLHVAAGTDAGVDLGYDPQGLLQAIPDEHHGHPVATRNVDLIPDAGQNAQAARADVMRVVDEQRDVVSEHVRHDVVHDPPLGSEGWRAGDALPDGAERGLDRTDVRHEHVDDLTPECARGFRRRSRLADAHGP